MLSFSKEVNNDGKCYCSQAPLRHGSVLLLVIKLWKIILLFNNLAEKQVKGTSCWTERIILGLSKNGFLTKGHYVMMETDLGRGSEVVFGNFSFFTVPSLLLGKDAQNQLLSEIR